MELRSDIAAAAARMTSGYEVQWEIRQLAAYLREGETVHRLASGIYGAGPGLLALTDHRVLLLRDGRSGQAIEGFPLERLTVAEWNPEGALGTITVSDSNSTAVLRDVPAADGAAVAGHIPLLTASGANLPTAWRWSTGGSSEACSPRVGSTGAGLASVGSVSVNTAPVSSVTVGERPEELGPTTTGGVAQVGSPAPLSALDWATGGVSTPRATTSSPTSALSTASTHASVPAGLSGSPGTGPHSPPASPPSLSAPTGPLAGVRAVVPDPTAPPGWYTTSTESTRVVPIRSGAEQLTARTGAYPSQYAPSADPAGVARELTRGAVPVSVLGWTGTIPAQKIESTDSGGVRLPPPSVEPGHGQRNGIERSGPLGSPEVMAGEVPVTQLAAEETAALAAAGSPAEPLPGPGNQTGAGTGMGTGTDHAAGAEHADGHADGMDGEPGRPAPALADRPQPIKWAAPSRVRRVAFRKGSHQSGSTEAASSQTVSILNESARSGANRAVGEATGKPATGAAGAGSAQASRGKKWIWLGAGAAGLIGLAALGSAKLISIDQPVAAPVSPAPAAVNSAVGPVVTVTNVINGDTVQVSGQYTGVVEVLGIIAPRPDKDQCGAATARAFALKTLNNTTVTLVSDPSQPITARNGDRLAFLRLPGGSDYSVTAARAGMARYYDSQPPVSTAADIKAAETQAENNHAGLWAAPCYGKFTSAGTSTGGGTSSTSGTGHSGSATTNTTGTSGADNTGGTSGSGNG